MNLASRRPRDRATPARPGPKGVDVNVNADGVASPIARRASSRPPRSQGPKRSSRSTRISPSKSRPHFRSPAVRGRRSSPSTNSTSWTWKRSADPGTGTSTRMNSPSKSRVPWPRRRSTPSSNRRSVKRSRRSRSSSARWACAAPPRTVPVARETGRGGRTGRGPRPRQAAHPGDPPPRRRGAGAGHQGGHRHQGADALDLHQHPRPLPGAHAGPGPRSASRGRSRTRTSAAACATSCSSSNPPKGVGFIVRTAGLDRTKRELSRDLAYLLRLWKVIVRRIKKLPAPVDIYQESDMIIRTIRDIFTAEVDTIYIDEPAAYERAQRVPATGHAALRQPPAALRRQGAAVLQVPPGRGDRQDPSPHGAAEGGRLDRHRPDRGPGGHRRQQRQLPRRGRRRGDRLPDEPPAPPRRSPGKSASATWAA